MPRPSHARLSHREPRFLGRNRGRGKKRRGGRSRISSTGSNSPLSTTSSTGSISLLDTMPSLHPESRCALKSLRETSDKQCTALATLRPKPSADCSTSTFPGSSLLLMPSPGQKLDRMLSMINYEDADFEHELFCIRMDLPGRKGPRGMHPLKAQRLRSLVALAHHLDEQDRFLRYPSHPDSTAANPSLDHVPQESLKNSSLTVPLCLLLTTRSQPGSKR